jgi:hypothetical protein
MEKLVPETRRSLSVIFCNEFNVRGASKGAPFSFHQTGRALKQNRPQRGGFVRLGAKDSNLYWLIQSQQSCH